MNDAVRRSIRGLVQGGIAETIVQFIEAFLAELNEAQHIALLGILTVAVTFVQNALEDGGQIPAVLKAPASDGEHPVPDNAEAGLSDPATVALVLIAVVLVLIAVGVVDVR